MTDYTTREKALSLAGDLPFQTILDQFYDDCIIYVEESAEQGDRRVFVAVRNSTDTEFVLKLARRSGYYPKSIDFEHGRITFEPTTFASQVAS